MNKREKFSYAILLKCFGFCFGYASWMNYLLRSNYEFPPTPLPSNSSGSSMWSSSSSYSVAKFLYDMSNNASSSQVGGSDSSVSEFNAIIAGLKQFVVDTPEVQAAFVGVGGILTLTLLYCSYQGVKYAGRRAIGAKKKKGYDSLDDADLEEGCKSLSRQNDETDKLIKS